MAAAFPPRSGGCLLRKTPVVDSTLRFLSIRVLHDSKLPARRRALLNQLPLSLTTALVYAGSAVFHTPLLANPSR